MATITGESVDRDVVVRVKEGDRTAWRGLVGEHLDLILAICRSYGLACDAASQVNQLVWLRLAEHLPRIRTSDTVGGWIAATARAECISPRYTAGRSGFVVGDIGGTDGDGNSPAPRVEGDGDGDGARSPGLASRQQMLVAAFGRLGSRCQRLLRLRLAVPGLGHEQIGAALDVAPCDVEGTADACLARLGRIAGLDLDAVRQTLGQLMVDGGTVPDQWWDAADAAFTWLTVDATYAELVYDSRAARTGLRPRMRHVRYAAGTRGVEVALDARDGEVMLSGHVAPAAPITVTACWGGGTVTADADGEGVFHIHGLPPRPLSLHLASTPPVKTGWLLP